MGVSDDFFASEYHRLNMQVARVIGAKASVDQALERAREVKSIPKWMIRYLESAAERLPGLSGDLATLRDGCCDACEAPVQSAARPTSNTNDTRRNQLFGRVWRGA